MSPVLGVLVAMALMAMLGALLATCGVLAGALAFAPSSEPLVADARSHSQM